MKAVEAEKSSAMADEDDDDDNDWALELIHEPKQLTDEEKRQQRQEAQIQSFFLERMVVYLAKLTQHDVKLASERPALLSVGCLFVAL